MAFALFVGFPLLFVGCGRFADPPLTLLMMKRLAEGRGLKQDSVSLGQVSPHLVRAVIAAEDTRFCSHRGFDFDAVLDAIAHNAEGGSVRGASTISQQTAKNFFLWPARSWLRKGFEAYFTLLIEVFWPKRRILEAYVGIAEWGPGVFGAQAAARHWFAKDAVNLNLEEAARLAAILPSPNRWRPDVPGSYVQSRIATIRARSKLVRTQGLADCVLSP